MHLSAHLFDDIEAKGVTRNYNTKPNEKMHGPLKDAYQDRTNFKNFAEQVMHQLLRYIVNRVLIEQHVFKILRYNHDSLVAEYIRSKMECLDAQNLGSSIMPDPLEADSDGLESTEPTDVQHFSLGSQQATKSFADIEAANAGDAAFDRFRIKLNEFLNRAFAANGIPFPNGRRIQLAANDMVR